MRYIVFAGHDYHPAGGWHDMRLCTEDKFMALSEADRCVEAAHLYAWAHVLDTRIMKLIYKVNVTSTRGMHTVIHDHNDEGF